MQANGLNFPGTIWKQQKFSCRRRRQIAIETPPPKHTAPRSVRDSYRVIYYPFAVPSAVS